MNITEDKLKAAIQIALGTLDLYTEEAETLLIHNIKALTIPVLSQRSKLFADQDSKEFVLWQRDRQIHRESNDCYKWREFKYNRDFFLEKYQEDLNKSNCG